MGKSTKGVEAVSIIEGADGPTSVFIAGKSDGRRKKSLSERIRQAIYSYRRKRIEKRIVARPHSTKEVAKYIQRKYNALEAPQTSRTYMEEYNALKQSLIIENRPELLGDLAEIKPLKDHSAESLKEFIRQVELQAKKAASIPDEAFPMDFHRYEMKFACNGRMWISLENIWGEMGASYSGDKKIMRNLKRISKEIHLYYGVSQEDIENRTKRYSYLVTLLSS